MEKDKYYKGLFLVASIYDIVLGLVFFFVYNALFNLLSIEIPKYPMYLQTASALVFVFGIAYYFIYLNPLKNIDLAKIGTIFKAVYSGLASYFYFTGKAPFIFFLFALLDILFLILFIEFLANAKKDKRYA